MIDSSNQPYKLKNLTKMNDIMNVNFLKFAFEFMDLVEICHLYIEKFNMIILLSEDLSYQYLIRASYLRHSNIKIVSN